MRLLTLIFAFALLPVVGCEKADLAAEKAIAPGMPYKTVVQIIGRPGRPLRPNEQIEGCLLPNLGETVYVWSGQHKSLLCIAFSQGRVTAMSDQG